MKLFRYLCGLALCAALFSPAVLAAGNYPDLSADHWAYADMDRAVSLGIITGFEDGSMAPEAPLTWGQFLVMLGRAFYPDTYAAVLSAGAEWDQAGYWCAWDNSLIFDGDFLPVNTGALWDPILRQDVCVLLNRALPDDGWRWLTDSHTITERFSDCEALPSNYHEPILQLYSKCIVRGKGEGDIFGVGETVKRSDGTVMLMRTLDQRAQTEASDLSSEESPGEDAPPSEPEVFRDPLLTQLGENDRKHEFLFGDPNKRRFGSEEEAEAGTVKVKVPIWTFSDGEKVSTTYTFTVHAALADDVTAIFTEIYNDPEQFPIWNLGGYDWRGNSATGEHNCGTAIDVNWKENFQVRDGRAQAGSHWKPGEDPYSIPPDGSVVRIFAEHGWSWGGDAWAESYDQSYGYHDYMHFSYMGL